MRRRGNALGHKVSKITPLDGKTIITQAQQLQLLFLLARSSVVITGLTLYGRFCDCTQLFKDGMDVDLSPLVSVDGQETEGGLVGSG